MYPDLFMCGHVEANVAGKWKRQNCCAWVELELKVDNRFEQEIGKFEGHDGQCLAIRHITIPSTHRSRNQTMEEPPLNAVIPWPIVFHKLISSGSYIRGPS
jgi:hypothetical protein